MLKKSILCLHGSQQNGETLKRLVGRKLFAKLQLDFTLNFFDAPHLLSMPDDRDHEICDGIPRTWYIRHVDGSLDWGTLEASLTAIEELWSCGNFSGIFAFSQGGAVGAILAALPERFPGLEFAIFVGSPYVRQLYHGNPLGISEYDIPEDVRSIHFFGLADYEVVSSSSMRLASLFSDPHFVEHEEGHCIPSTPHFVSIFSHFLDSIVAQYYDEPQKHIDTAGDESFHRNGGRSHQNSPSHSERRKQSNNSGTYQHHSEHFNHKDQHHQQHQQHHQHYQQQNQQQHQQHQNQQHPHRHQHQHPHQHQNQCGTYTDQHQQQEQPHHFGNHHNRVKREEDQRNHQILALNKNHDEINPHNHEHRHQQPRKHRSRYRESVHPIHIDTLEHGYQKYVDHRLEEKKNIYLSRGRGRRYTLPLENDLLPLVIPTKVEDLQNWSLKAAAAEETAESGIGLST